MNLKKLHFSKERIICEEIFRAGIERVKPGRLLNDFIRVDNEMLHLGSCPFKLSAIDNLYVIGFGKASAAMAAIIEDILGDYISEGHVITKYNHALPLSRIGLTEAGHPLPDSNGLKGTRCILDIVEKAGSNDLVICLISGGGSSLLCDLPDGEATIEDLQKLNELLIKSGADIREINLVRKHLSRVKGGFLAKAACPARLISLIISDVVGDPPDIIASGPTVPDPGTFDDALDVCRRYKLENDIPRALLHYLKEGSEGRHPETPKADDETFKKTTNILIGNNKMALEAAAGKAETLGYHSRVVTTSMQGEVQEVARWLVEAALEEKEKQDGLGKCLLLGGETVVKVQGDGKGGRNQHLALLVADQLKGAEGITLLAGGSDGTDGPTNAAGAVTDAFTLPNAEMLGIIPGNFISNFDSFNFFKQEGGLLITGPTYTNVMDLIILLIEK